MEPWREDVCLSVLGVATSRIIYLILGDVRFFFFLQFDYLNGAGSKVDRFAIDLYMEGGSGDCGTWVTSICDKPSIGCKDSSELTPHLDE